MARLDLKLLKSVRDPGIEETRKRALLRLRELIGLSGLNAIHDGGEPAVTAIIDIDLERAKTRHAERALDERKLILQSFPEERG
jgi:hypothetical protein